jgi:hypothetical protein
LDINISNNNVTGKIVNQLDSALSELKKAKSSTYLDGGSSRQEIAKAEGILETIKALLEG